MNIVDFFKQDLNRSLLIGYYGGGNFGDELLLEVLLNLLKEKNLKGIELYYSNPKSYSTYHHDFGTRIIDSGNKRELLAALFRSKNIIVGGGGLWGLDFNANIFLLSIILMVARYCLGKRVYLLGVGYYGSAPRLGKLAAYFAGLASNAILCRDEETYKRFEHFHSKTSLVEDLAFSLPSLDLEQYQSDLSRLEQELPIAGENFFVSLRRFQEKYRNNYNELVTKLVTENSEKDFIFSISEPQEVDPVGFELITRTAREHPNVRALQFSYNPIALCLYFKKHSKELKLIAPQYHLILVAFLTDVKCFPLVYDNKVTELLKKMRSSSFIDIQSVSYSDLSRFVQESSK